MMYLERFIRVCIVPMLMGIACALSFIKGNNSTGVVIVFTIVCYVFALYMEGE